MIEETLSDDLRTVKAHFGNADVDVVASYQSIQPNYSEDFHTKKADQVRQQMNSLGFSYKGVAEIAEGKFMDLHFGPKQSTSFSNVASVIHYSEEKEGSFFITFNCESNAVKNSVIFELNKYFNEHNFEVYNKGD